MTVSYIYSIYIYIYIYIERERERERKGQGPLSGFQPVASYNLNPPLNTSNIAIKTRHNTTSQYGSKPRAFIHNTKKVRLCGNEEVTIIQIKT